MSHSWRLFKKQPLISVGLIDCFQGRPHGKNKDWIGMGAFWRFFHSALQNALADDKTRRVEERNLGIKCDALNSTPMALVAGFIAGSCNVGKTCERFVPTAILFMTRWDGPLASWEMNKSDGWRPAGTEKGRRTSQGFLDKAQPAPPKQRPPSLRFVLFFFPFCNALHCNA